MNSYKLNNNPLDLKWTLTCGQAFRWKNIDNKWFGFINNKPIFLWCENDVIYWEGDISLREIIKYFNFDTNLNKIYSDLIENDKNLEPIIEKFYGIRILKQNTEETLYSFLCSAANSIPKIMVGIEKISKLFPNNKNIFQNKEVYSFPNTKQLTESNVENLKNIKEIAFRGKNIFETANIINNIPNFFEKLSIEDYSNAKKNLTNVKNIGPKIADCICLFSLNMPQVVPVDTHVKQIAQKKFGYKMIGKSITTTNYKEIQKVFFDHYGYNSGLAQQFLFINEIE